ncbi:MAG: DUF2798 domain-containing protein [Limnobacter sp.]|jgi:hypothetical protein|uniref:DUF2798 domain-containing protein n=1 Tax=Limnobacter sp. TaxID=2003368 RepID=UPI0011F6F79D|nr:DUF2798 domain-containing protein [Limnobacter sp.]MDZ4050398.1 DUF2798 domain-containing protein [Limnobacter sp.]RZO92965.1 MAG: DUF2798 domain-containing protein [Limnobacter sp.]
MNALPQAQPGKLFQLVFALIMGFLMVGIVTFVTTASNFGFGGNFLATWGKTYLIGYLAAVPSIYLLAPIARRITAQLLN